MTPRIVLCGVLALASIGCDKQIVDFHASTASVDRIELGRGYEGDRATGVGTSFAPSDTALHAVIAVSAVPPDTKITGSWIAVEAAGVKDQLIDRSEFRAIAGTTSVHFTLTNDKPWPTGRYRFDVQIEGEPLQSREFEVLAPASASDRVAFGGDAPVAAPTPTPAPVATHGAAPAHVAAPTHAAAPTPVAAATPGDAPEPEDAATPEAAATSVEAPRARKGYAASVAGICEKMVDCGCESSASACGQTLSGLNPLPASVKRCVLAYGCSDLCGSGAQHCVTDYYANEAEITRQIGEMSRKQREAWPTGDDKHCPSGYHRVGETCYAD
jgi:hypothetical protein